jgi:hypothetical protein
MHRIFTLLLWCIGTLCHSAALAQENCSANRAVYSRGDSKEFVVKHVGVVGSELHGTGYLEGELGGEAVAFLTDQRPNAWSSGGTDGKFTAATDQAYARSARYLVKWNENPTHTPDQLLLSPQGTAWGGGWKLVRCDGNPTDPAQEAAHAINCPVDRVIFLDRKTGLRFRAERYAEDFVYLTARGVQKKPPKSVRNEAVWAKRLGFWVLEGNIEGSKAYVRYEQIDGVPCCSFSSHYPNDSEIRQTKFAWSTPDTVPTVNDETRSRYSPDEIDMYIYG